MISIVGSLTPPIPAPTRSQAGPLTITAPAFRLHRHSAAFKPITGPANSNSSNLSPVLLRTRASLKDDLPPPKAVAAEVVPDNAFGPQARLASARSSQQRCTELLALLLEAGDPVGEARRHVEGLSEEFFMTASTYLTLARQEGNTDVASRLERAVSAAWSVKQSTLRPELQLLNSLVRTEGEAERRQIYLTGGPDLLSTLSMNDRWFAATLATMMRDVERQPPHPDRAALLGRLRAIRAETEALERQAARQQQHQR